MASQQKSINMARKFIEEDPKTPIYTPRLSETAWESQRALLSDLHAQGKSYPEMLEVLKSMGFHASLGQLKARMDKWGFVKHRIEPNTPSVGVGQHTLSTRGDVMDSDMQNSLDQRIQEPPKSEKTLGFEDDVVIEMGSHMSPGQQLRELGLLESPWAPIDKEARTLRSLQLENLGLSSVLPATAKSYTSSISSGFKSFKALSRRIPQLAPSSAHSVRSSGSGHRSTGSGQFSAPDPFAPFATVLEEEARDENSQPSDVVMGGIEEE